jgi:hypothetical protein
MSIPREKSGDYKTFVVADTGLAACDSPPGRGEPTIGPALRRTANENSLARQTTVEKQVLL